MLNSKSFRQFSNTQQFLTTNNHGKPKYTARKTTSVEIVDSRQRRSRKIPTDVGKKRDTVFDVRFECGIQRQVGRSRTAIGIDGGGGRGDLKFTNRSKLGNGLSCAIQG